jgi:hypothetical protein
MLFSYCFLRGIWRNGIYGDAEESGGRRKMFLRTIQMQMRNMRLGGVGENMQQCDVGWKKLEGNNGRKFLEA